MTGLRPDVSALHTRVQQYLREKQLVYEVQQNGSIWIRQGSTVVVVEPAAWNERTVVKLMAPVALNITKITPELTRYLAEQNYRLLFGKFSLDADGKAVWYEHILLGDNLDVEELFIAVAAVALTADENDEEIAQMAGGQRLVDL